MIDTVKFTPMAQQVLAVAAREADRLNHSEIGAEHLLLAIVALAQGVAFSVLRQLGVNVENLRAVVLAKVAEEPNRHAVPLPYNHGLEMVLEMATEESKSLKHAYVGTEHLLLGILKQKESMAASVLAELGVKDLEKVRREILDEINPSLKVKVRSTKSSASAESSLSAELTAIVVSCEAIIKLPEGTLRGDLEDRIRELKHLAFGQLQSTEFAPCPKALNIIDSTIVTAGSLAVLEVCGRTLVAIFGAERAAEIASERFSGLAGLNVESPIVRNWGTVIQLLTGEEIDFTVKVDFLAVWRKPSVNP